VNSIDGKGITNTNLLAISIKVILEQANFDICEEETCEDFLAEVPLTRNEIDPLTRNEIVPLTRNEIVPLTRNEIVHKLAFLSYVFIMVCVSPRNIVPWAPIPREGK